MNSLSENNNTLFYPTTVSPDTILNDSKSNIKGNEELSATNLNQVWTKNKFNNKNNQKQELVKLDNTKMSWSFDINNKPDDEPTLAPFEQPVAVKDEAMVQEIKPEVTAEEETGPPPHHARRPMNAFLIFCKKHRPIVRKKYPNLENRGVTRILGEWWALLDQTDKNPYTALAKEYKDAFFSANPNFKWYKLPAPSLRALSTRPANIKQESSPLPSPTNVSSPNAEFTPGKLADESQLGMLSCLLNSNQTYTNKVNDIKTNVNNNNQTAENNNTPDFESLLQSPVNCISNPVLPPKPIKKRIYESFMDSTSITRNLFENAIDDELTMTNGNNLNMTQQQIVNQTVDSKFQDIPEASTAAKNGFKMRSKDARKSGRKCKGKRYAEFMADGKLLKNKRDKPEKIVISNNNTETPKIVPLDSTITRLQERVLPKLLEGEAPKIDERARTNSETSENGEMRNISAFHLDQRIAALSSLSYDSYVQKKRDSKKRKLTRVNKAEHKPKTDVHDNLVGSKKRKNKRKITHLENNDFVVTPGITPANSTDLSGLTTLAEIAAITAKINDNA